MRNGVHILLIDLQITIIVSCVDLIAAAGTQVRRQLVHSQQTGLVKTIGGAHQWVLFPESLDMPMQACSAYGTLIVPCWPSAPFWPILCPTENQFAPFVTEVIQLPQQEGLFLPSVSGAVLFNGEVPNTVVYALKCEF